jgi:hypothetical protein
MAGMQDTFVKQGETGFYRLVHKGKCLNAGFGAWEAS